MKPYYQDDAVTIYHGHSLTLLAGLQEVDLILTDPPYGIDADRDRNCQENGWRDYGSSGWDKKRPSRELITALSQLAPMILWGGNYFADWLPASMGWLSWDKGQRDFSLADFELAWTSFQRASRCFQYSRAKAMQDGKVHPTQKPVSLMVWCIAHADKAMKSHPKTILDPFMGSGTTLRAAKDIGRKGNRHRDRGAVLRDRREANGARGSRALGILFQLHLLPAPRLYREIKRKMRDPLARPHDQAFELLNGERFEIVDRERHVVMPGERISPLRRFGS